MNSQLTQFNRLKNRSGKNVEVIRADNNIVETTCIIKEFDNGNSSSDDKTIFFDIKDNIQQGDLIKYENNTYIILLQQENINNVYCIYVMRRCDTTIKMYIDGKLEEIPCNIQTFTQDVFENKYLNLPSGNIKVTIQNDISKEITYNKRFIKMGNAWKVVGLTSENKGLKYLYCEKTEINNTVDDIENEIADRWKHEVKHNYSMTIDTDNITLEEGQTKQLIVNINDTIDDKTETVENPILIYTSLNENIVKIDDKGLIKGISEGEATIKITFENIDKIINVKVVKPLPITTTYEFKTITLDGVEFTGDTITLDNGTSKVLKVTEIIKTTTQGDKSNIEVINNPIVAYSVNNSNITVDNTGKITGTNVGNSIVTVSYENIKKDINITVNDVAKLEIIGSDKIVQRKQRGEYTSNIPVTWNIEDVDNNTSTKWGIIISESENKCIVQVTSKWIFGDGKNKYIKLTATSKDNRIVESKKIKISQF